MWPAISTVFRRNASVFSALFANGHPTEQCKLAIAAGARRLGLRNLIEREGLQEYFDTLKLQIGFTHRGATEHLPEWLNGAGQPMAVRILLGTEPDIGGLQSAEFQELWRALGDYRRSRISKQNATSILQRSAWVRPTWIADLLEAAKARSRGEDGERGDERSVGALCEPMLVWDGGSPALMLSFDEARARDALEGYDFATIAVDRQVVGRWIRQENGQWSGRLVPCQKQGARTNWRPQLLSISSGDATVREVDLGSELGLNEPLLIFDIANGRLVPGERIDVRRGYAFLCDPDIEVPGAQVWRSRDRSIFRLAPPLSADTRVLCGGEMYWQPQVREGPPRRSFNLGLEASPGDVLETGAAANLLVTGVPEDVTSAELVIHAGTRRLLREGARWRTESPVRISLELAMGEERTRIRLRGEAFSRTVPAKVALNVRGVAVLASEGDEAPRWESPRRGFPLNRAGGAGKARVLIQGCSGEVYEGPRSVCKLRSPILDFRELRGWGAPLGVRGDDGAEIALADSVVDRGCIDFPLPSSLSLRLLLRTPLQPNGRYAVLAWGDIDAQPRNIAPAEVKAENDGFVWRFPNPGHVAAAAVTYEGAPLGAYWDASSIKPALLRQPSAKRFALLRWLKFPILDERHRGEIQSSVLRAPAEFVRGWLGDGFLPAGLVHRVAEEGLDGVIRAFLWTHVEREARRMWEIAKAFPRSGGGLHDPTERARSVLIRLAEACPPLAYNLAKLSLRVPMAWAYRRAIEEVVAASLERSSVGALGRQVAELVGVEQRTLVEAVVGMAGYLDDLGPLPLNINDLRRAGERQIGRRYLTAALLLRLRSGGMGR
ncbi:MAG TPA: hypothetical protein VIY49_16075 [Bryobacteraceae bacterium]